MGERYEMVKDYAGLLGLGMIFATGFVTILTWLVAWWNGITTGKYKVVVNINAFGEMTAEFWLIWIVLALGVWGMYWYIHEAILERRAGYDEAWPEYEEEEMTMEEETECEEAPAEEAPSEEVDMGPRGPGPNGP